MKITRERLRQIITEEVIKEELAPEIAAPAIAAMLRGMEAEETSDIFGDVFTHMYGEEALQAQADAEAAGSPEEQDYPTEYQTGGAYGDRPQVGFNEDIEKIIKEEFKAIIEGHGGEGSMARSQLGRTAEIATMLQDMITDESNLEEWVESKITKAQDYLTAVLNYMRGEELSGKEPMMEEKEIPDLSQSGPELEKLIQQVLPAIEQATAGNENLKKLSLQRLFQLLQKEGGVEALSEDIMQMTSELKKIDSHPADLQVAERKLTKPEEKEKEKVVKGMKKSKKDFEKRYGDDAESVMYATATKMAKEKK